MICPHCGNPTPDGKPFCVNCGKGIVGDPFRPGGQQSYAPPYAPVYNGMEEPVRTVTFGEAVRGFFAHYADFSGRATRSEYWFAWLFCFGVSTVLGLLVTLTEGSILGLIPALASMVFALGTLIPNLAVTWRRLHDSGRSGCWWFLNFLPFVGSIIVLVLLCMDSDRDNQYGPRRTNSNHRMYP